MDNNGPAGETRRQDEILNIADALIQTRGFSAFSYQDIADRLGIRKASIHYYFPSKAGLGGAALDRYAQRHSAMLDALDSDNSLSPRARVEAYMRAMLELAETTDRVCLAGALAAELMALPAALRDKVDRFFQTQQAWLAKTIAQAQAGGGVAADAAPDQVARLVFSALQGALLIGRTTGDLQQMRDVVYALKKQLFGKKA